MCLFSFALVKGKSSRARGRKIEDRAIASCNRNLSLAEEGITNNENGDNDNNLDEDVTQGILNFFPLQIKKIYCCPLRISFIVVGTCRDYDQDESSQSNVKDLP